MKLKFPLMATILFLLIVSCLVTYSNSKNEASFKESEIPGYCAKTNDNNTFCVTGNGEGGKTGCMNVFEIYILLPCRITSTPFPVN